MKSKHYNKMPSLHLSNLIPFDEINANCVKILSPDQSIWFSYGRDALLLLAKHIKNKGKTKILLPSYVCDVAVLPFVGILDISYYEVNKSLVITEELIKEHLSRDIGLVMLVDYFGFNQEYKQQIINYCKSKGVQVIEDLAHKFPYSKNENNLCVSTRADYALFSLHKQLPIPDGSLLYSANRADKIAIESMIVQRRSMYHGLRTTIKLLKNAYLGELNQTVTHSKVDENMSIAEKIDDAWGKRSRPVGNKYSIVAQYLLSHVDVVSIITKRHANYMCYAENIVDNSNVIHLNKGIGEYDEPYVYPILLPNVTEQQRRLLTENIPGYFWPRLHSEIKNNCAKYPVACSLAGTMFLLSIQQDMNITNIKEISKTFNAIMLNNTAI